MPVTQRAWKSQGARRRRRQRGPLQSLYTRIVAVHSSRAQAHLTVGVVRRRWMKSRALRLATSAAHAMSAERFEASTAATPTAVQNVAPSRTRTFGGYIRGSTGRVNT
jgi:hypothetical protein